MVPGLGHGKDQDYFILNETDTDIRFPDQIDIK